MKYLRCPQTTQLIEIGTDSVLSVDYESPDAYGKALVGISNLCNGFEQDCGFQFYADQFKEINSSDLFFISDIISFDFGTSKIATAIKKKLQIRASNEIELWNKVEHDALVLGESSLAFLHDCMLPFSINEDWSVLRWIKACEVKIDWTPTSSLLEKLELIVKTNMVLNLSSILIFSGLNQYLSEDEQSELFHYAVSLNQTIVIIQLSVRNRKIMPYEQRIFIDRLNESYISDETPHKKPNSAFDDFVEVLE